MPVYSIPLSALPAATEQSHAWCAQLEAGGILYFPETPVPIPAADIDFLLNTNQSAASRVHKNIAYKPGADVLTGVDRSGSDHHRFEQLHDIMQRYSVGVASFLSDFLAPYHRRWQLDYASYRPIEESSRNLPTHKRNDLLHTDAFPTRPTGGARILRFFHNIHPTRTRDWVVGEPFQSIVGRFVRPASAKGENGSSHSGASSPHPLTLPQPDSAALRAARSFAQSTGLAALVPRLKRSPYDEFMMRLHNTMKEDAEFQRTCSREEVKFPPGSSWMVYTETVPHAVMAGQYALEQTFLVDAAAMVTPESAPVAVLKRMAQHQPA